MANSKIVDKLLPLKGDPTGEWFELTGYLHFPDGSPPYVDVGDLGEAILSVFKDLPGPVYLDDLSLTPAPGTRE